MNKPKLEKYKAIGDMDKWICFDGRVSCTGSTQEEAYQGYCKRKGQVGKFLVCEDNVQWTTGVPIPTGMMASYNEQYSKEGKQEEQRQPDNVHTTLKHVDGNITHVSVMLYETQKQLDEVRTLVRTLLALFILCVPILFALVLNNV